VCENKEKMEVAYRAFKGNMVMRVEDIIQNAEIFMQELHTIRGVNDMRGDRGGVLQLLE
jgi:hypothetical protein